MKKFMVLFLVAFMAIAGTAMAQTSVELSTATSGVSTVFWGPTYGTAAGGASAYVITGGIATNANKLDAGTTVYAISNTLANAAGTELRTQRLLYVAGATPIGSAQLVSGTTDTVIAYVQSGGGVNGGQNVGATGTTLYAINGGTGAAIWSIGLYSFAGINGAVSQGIYNATAAGATFYSLAPVTIDNSNTNYSGATIYGVIGGVSSIPAYSGGVSVFAVSAQTGTFTVTGGRNGVTDIYAPDPAAFANSGVSAVHAAPVISGNSLFIVGFAQPAANVGGLTLYQLNKNNVFNGFTTAAAIKVNNPELGDQFTPTPAASGGSIFVVEPRGGVTSYRADNLAVNYRVRYTGGEAISGVSAGPVTDGTYIVLCSTSSVTGYRLNTLSGNSKQWTFNFGPAARYQINTTPAMSNGFVWVTVNDLTLNTAATYRFTLSSNYDGAPVVVKNYGQLVYGSPIIVSGNLWSATFDPTVEKTVAPGASGLPYWPQFKFDAAKTGFNNDADDDDEVPDDDDSGCFISTLK